MKEKAITALMFSGCLCASSINFARTDVVTSQDIYAPAAYETELSADESGTYVLINRGEQSFKGYEKTDQFMKFSSRFVVLLEKRDSGEPYLISICDGQDWGRLSDQGIKFTQHGDDRGRFSAVYEKNIPEFSTVLPKGQWNNPLTILPYYSDTDTPRESLKQLHLKGTFDLVRIAPFKSHIGRVELSYVLGGEKFRRENACFIQTTKDWTVVFHNSQKDIRSNTLHEVFAVREPRLERKLTLDMFDGDILWPGIDPAKSAKAGFIMRLESAKKNSIYMDMSLSRRGETGRVSQNIVANDIHRLEISGNANPDQSGKFMKGSMPANYHVVLPLK